MLVSSIAYAPSRAVRATAEVAPRTIGPVVDAIAEGGAECDAALGSHVYLALHQLQNGIAINFDIRHPNTAIVGCVENQQAFLWLACGCRTTRPG